VPFSRGDQAHFGPVFGPFHRLWLLEFERALRATDSRIEGLPYWDFGRENSSNFQAIFSDDYFGSLTGDAPDFVIKDGKFAYWGIKKESERNASVFKGVMNIYGYMRHPLSVNKAPFLTRRGGIFCGSPFTSFGDVNMWSGCLSVGDNIADWASCVDSFLHGPAHVAISGSWRREGQTFDAPNCSQWFGYISPPGAFTPMGTFISAFGLGCFDCAQKCSIGEDCFCRPRQKLCGPLWTGLRSGNKSRDLAANVELVDPDFIQILGDLGDPVASPNDPM
jgi:hypothetical protein